MSGFANHVGLEQEVPALGQTWKLSRLTRGVWRQFFGWARTILPDPQAEAHKHISRLAKEEYQLRRIQAAVNTPDEHKTPEQRALLALPENADYLDPGFLAHALQTNQDEQKQACTTGLDKATSTYSLNSPQIQSLLASIDGITQLMYLRLKPNHPDVTEDQAFAIVEEMSPEEASASHRVASGEAPAAKNPSGRADS